MVTAPGHAAETGLPYAALTLLTARLTAPGTPAVPAVLGAAATHPAAPQARVPDSAADLARCLLDLLGAAARHRPLLLVVDDVQHWDAPSRTVLGLAARRLGPHCPAALLLTADTHHGTAPDRPDASGRRPGRPLRRAAAPRTRPADGLRRGGARERHRPGPGRPGRPGGTGGRRTRPPRHARRTARRTHPAAALRAGGTARPAARHRAAAALHRPTRATAHRGAGPTAHPGRRRGGRRILAGRTPPAVGHRAGRGRAGTHRAGRPDGGRAGRHRRRAPGRPAVHRSALAGRRPPAGLGRRPPGGPPPLAADTAGTGPHLVHLWHTASAAPAPDPAAADALDAAARHASAPDAGVTVLPGGLAALLALAAGLGPQSALAADRYARAAEQARLAGRTGLARQLLDRARRLPADRPTTGRATRTTGLVELAEGSAAQARATLALAAGLLSPADPDLALDARRHAAEAAWAAGDLAGCRAETAALLPQPGTVGTGATAVPAVMLHSARGAAAAFDRHYSRGIPALRRTVADAAPEHETESTVENGSAALARALAAAAVLGDAAAARDLAGRAVARARARGHDADLPHLLQRLAFAELYAGLPERAGLHARRGLDLAERVGGRNSAAHHHAVLALAAAVRGDAESCTRHAAEADRTADANGLATVRAVTAWARARRDAAADRPDRAAARLLALVAPGPARGHFALRLSAVPCLVEVCVRVGRCEEARPAVREFGAWAAAGAARTRGRWRCAVRRCWPRRTAAARTPSCASTGSHWPGMPRPTPSWSTPAPRCCSARLCGGSAAPGGPGTTCRRRWTASSGAGPGRGRRRPGVNCGPPAPHRTVRPTTAPPATAT
ncbi:hypothetical protein ACFQ1I_07230 [Kitasatospora arboriphila]